MEEQLEFSGKTCEAANISVTTIAADPKNPSGYLDLAAAEWPLGHLQSAYDNIVTAKRLLSGSLPRDFSPEKIPFLIANTISFENDLGGAYGDAVAADIAESKTGEMDLSISAPAALANDYALDHDIAAARSILARYRLSSDDILLTPEFVTTTGPDLPNFYMRANADDWTGARDALERTDQETPPSKQRQCRAPHADLAVACLRMGQNWAVARCRRPDRQDAERLHAVSRDARPHLRRKQATLGAPPIGLTARSATRRHFPSATRIGATCFCAAAMSTAPLRNIALRMRKARTMPMQSKCGAKR